MTSTPPPPDYAQQPGSQPATAPPQQWPAGQPAWQQPAWSQAPPAVPAGYQAGPAGGPQPGYGYPQQPMPGYGPMPSYPPPQIPPPPRPPQQRGVPAWVWVIAASLVVAVAAVWLLPSILDRHVGPDPDPTVGPTAEPTDGFGQPNTASSGTFTGEHMIESMNAALAAKDRAAFFRFVEGDAVAPLNLWWDNMDVLQWTAGALSVGPGQLDSYADDTIQMRVTLGAVTAGSPSIPGNSDHPDAGTSYAPSNIYRATIRVTDDGASGVITGWELQTTAAPWDLEPLYAVVSEHSVMAGYADEKDLIDRVAPLGDTGAAWVIETYQSETGVANAQRFATFVTEDPDRFNDWFIEDTSGWVADRAGTMFPQRRPFPAAGIPTDIAVGSSRTNAGGILTIGPGGLLYGEEDTLDTIVHEFVHAMHTTNVPEEAWPGSTVMEGWAVYNESLFRSDGEFGRANSYIGRLLRDCVASEDFTGLFPTQQDFVDVDTVHCAYMLSGSMYAYAASLGVDVYEAADLALEEGDSLPDVVAAMSGPVIDEAGWADWLRTTFGS